MSWQNVKIIGSNQKRGEAGQERGHKSFVMSRSQLVAFAECPEKWVKGEAVEEESKAMTFGSVLDCLATTPDELLKKFAVTPETYPATPTKKSEPPEQKPWTSRANYCKDWEAEKEAEGFAVVSQAMMEDAKRAFNALHQNEAVERLIECSDKQVLIVAEWKDDDTGLIVPFSALLDLVPSVGDAIWGKTLADIKTARNGNPSKWARVCDDSGYDVQAALYFDLYRAARPNEDRTDFVHVVQENTFPFHVVNPPPALSEEFLNWGRMKYKKALRHYCKCLTTGIWPSYEQVGETINQSGGGNTQIIGPEDCWNYKKSAGMTEFRMPEPKPAYAVGHDLYATA